MSIHSELLKHLPIERPLDPLSMPALTLAYLGDTVYDLYIRTYLAETLKTPVRELHKEAAKRVCAKGQAHAYYAISPLLDEEEQAAFRRGRNAHSATVPKNANVRDYRVATGLEALFGYLYLKGEDARIGELMQSILEQLDATGKENEHGISKK